MKASIRHIIFEVTQQCNLTCRYCYNHWRRPGETVLSSTFSQTARTLDRLFQCIECEHITFTGGEPFLADGLAELVLKCRLKGKGVSIISNGTVATTDQYEQLHRLGVSIFQLPLLAATPELHDRLTGVNGSHAAVLRSLEQLLAAGASTGVVFVITRWNLEQLQPTLELATTLGIPRLLLARFNVGGRGIQYRAALQPSREELHAVFRCAHDFVQHHPLRITANVCLPFCVVNPHDFPRIPISSCSLDINRRPITVDFCGNVRFCNHSPTSLGSLFENTIEELLRSESATRWQMTVPSTCANCLQWQQCRGGCRAASQQLGLGLEQADPIVETLSMTNAK